MAVTISDVARAAGVSTKTVSNVLNDYPFLREETRTRVQSAIASLGYRPNPSARRLRQGRTGMVALVLPDLTSPWFAALAHEVGLAAGRTDETVLIEETGGDPERELAALGALSAQPVDGVLLCPMALDGPRLTAARPVVPVVVLGGQPEQVQHDHVALDNAAATRLATEHLIASGRRRIAYLGAGRGGGGMTARRRLEGHIAALDAAGLPHDPSREIEATGWGRADGAAAVAALLGPGGPAVDALVCANDLLALGAMSALQSAGARVPTDVAVVGFDDVEDGRFATPALTSIRPDLPALAGRALDLLRERTARGGSAIPPRRVVVPFDLVVRASSGGPPVAAPSR